MALILQSLLPFFDLSLRPIPLLTRAFDVKKSVISISIHCCLLAVLSEFLLSQFFLAISPGPRRNVLFGLLLW